MADLELARNLNSIAWEAGRVTLKFFRSNTAVESKADQSPVTEADRAAEDYILSALGRLYPGIPVVAEESVSANRVPPPANRFFLVDPLDGTKEFIAGRSDYTVNIALIESHAPVAGVVHAPARRVSYAGALGLGSIKSNDGDLEAGDRISVRSAAHDALVAVASRSHNSPETDRFLSGFKVAEKVSVGSSLKFCLLASGEADLYPRFGRTMEWDTAAGHAVLLAAGGSVLAADGAPLGYDKRDQADDADFANPHFVAFADRTLDVAVRKGLATAAVARAS